MPDVRPGTEADLPHLRAIQTAALAEPWPDLLDLAAGDGGPRLRVLVDDGDPVGYAVAVTAAHPHAYVPEIAVRPDRQREGLGSRLLRSLLAELADEGIERVRLTARVGDGVVVFYRAHDFEPVERVEDHFESSDGLVLERSLRGEG